MIRTESFEYFNYGTDAVVNDDIFDTKQTGMSFYDQAIPGNKDYQYMIDEKNLKGTIVQMTPEEYYERCVRDIFKRGTVDSIKQSRDFDTDYINHLKSVITDKKEKFPITMLDYTEPSQEGLHRMYVAGELFGWDHKFPVLIINWADEQRHKDEVNSKRKRDIEYNIQTALHTTLRWTFENEEDFKNNLQDEINHEFLGYDSGNQDFTLEIKNNKIYVTVDDVTVDEDASKLKIQPSAPITESFDKNRLDELNKLLQDKFGSQFFTTTTPQDGPCYLLSDGKFFYYGKADKEYLVHNMEIEYLVDENIIDNDTGQQLARTGELWPYIKAKDTMMLNDGYYRSEECVIRLLTTHPTTAQLNSLKEWIEHLQTEPSFEGQLQVTTWSYWRGISNSGYQIYDMKDEEIDTNYIMNKIKWFYSSGKLLA